MDTASSSSSSSSSFTYHSPSHVPSTSSANPHVPKRKAGRKKFRETRHPVYHGVRERNSGKWVCEVREPQKKTRIWLGTFPTPEMAGRAHDVAAIALRGKSAPLNFPDSAWTLPRARSASAKDIQSAASDVAEMFRPASSSSTPPSSSVAPSRLVLFEDEEALFNLPGLLDSMAEGLLITPPAMKKGFDWDHDVDCHEGLSLWCD